MYVISVTIKSDSRSLSGQTDKVSFEIVFLMKLLILIAALAAIQNIEGHYFEKFKTLRRPIPLDATDPVILTPLIESGRLEEARNLSRVNHPEFRGIEFYSGYLQVDKVFDNNLFFYFFPSEGDYLKDPVLLWLQGGPGAPAGYGLFLINGPFIVNKNYSVDLREYRWTKNHSVLYIDNPVGTGFSFTTKNGYAQNQTKVGEDLYEALLQFFTLFSEIQGNDFCIIGESYAGKYVPAIGYTILQNNPTADLKINLKSLATGNGLSDAVHQSNYGDYLYQIGLVDKQTRDIFHEYSSLVSKYVAEENWYEATKIFNEQVGNLISNATAIDSLYNYLQMDPDEEEYWQKYIQEELRDPLHIGNTEFNSGPVFDLLYEDICKSVAPWIAELLSHYRFLIYSGQVDVIVAYPLTENFLQNLNFNAAEEYKRASREVWSDEEGTVGYYKQAGNLTEMLIRNAGHMVPVAQPQRAYRMVYNFVRNKPFAESV
ncbi:venom serine carboxypeptidase-like [Anthonomus grandis grandis]|uniref:venom serine carboxypeptidase-like n=1 Tax=Anthonomus grandis grandis TaxID=2921223 RepID=UPI0021658443|nr:venom serine carboxypeptidase-like [Anthonomus grandis grandis]